MFQTSGRYRFVRVGLLIVGLLAGLLVGGPLTARGQAADLELNVVSSPRADMVSDGNALVQVTLGDGADPDDVTIQVNGDDATSSFTPDPGGASMTGLIDDLDVGPNTVVAEAAGDRDTMKIENHPRSGPMLSGPQQQPYACQTEDFTTLAGEKLGPADGADCSVDTRVDYLYRSVDGGDLKPLLDGEGRPEDLATATTRTGKKVPYIVRVETGVINRSIYEYAVLHDPDAGEPSYDKGPSGWNSKIIYTFGGGCTHGWYRQGSGTGGVGDDVMLSRGYAVVSSSLNVFGNNCNGVLAAETMAMTREHVIETIGEPEGTIGWGCSGGSYQVFQIGDNYPGLLDGIVAGCVFPDVAFATLHTITDARLLDHYFNEHEEYSDEQRRAVSGFGVAATLPNLANSALRIDPEVFCPDELPENERYEPETNPDGARCDVYDHQVNVWGQDPRTGAARRPLDNVGIQYGLAALNSGAITLDQFIDLNASVGGFDDDAKFQAERTVADGRAVRTAYRTGQLTNGGGGLATVPIIDFREYTDTNSNGDIHLRFHSFSFQERLRKANGDADNLVMQVEGPGNGGFSTRNGRLATGLEQMDQWVSAIASGEDSGHQAVVGAKPEELVDACWAPDGEKIIEPQVDGVGTTPCNTLFPSYPSPRQVAGSGVVNDVIACRLVPVDADDYDVDLTAQDLADLRETFPSGVCDWDAAGRQQQGLAGTWPSFQGTR